MSSVPARALFLSFLLCLLAQADSAPVQAVVPEVSLSANISSHVIREDELLPFLITIKNKADGNIGSGIAVNSITLWKLPDSYRLDDSQPICVVPILPPRTQPCETSQAFFASHNLIASSLAPGGIVTVQGYLKPTALHNTSTLTSLVTWNFMSKEKEKGAVAVLASQGVSLGENQVVDASWIARLSLDELLKILAVPALLLLVGAAITAFVNFINVSREKRAATAQAAIDAARHIQEQERAVRAETWKQMLPVSHNYAAKFYLPLSLAAERFADSLKQSNARLAFFYLLFCGRKMIATRNEIGGFYFKDLRGESLAAVCWKNQRLACLGEEDNPLFLAVLDSIDQLEDIDSYEGFEKRFADVSGGVVEFAEDSIQQAWTLFQAWIGTGNVAPTIQYLEGFYAVLDFESNRPYEYWYDTPAKLKITAETEQLLRKLLADEKKYSAEEINGYFTSTVRP
jgi:hypothetical protein